jgi:hypothetical protein
MGNPAMADDRPEHIEVTPDLGRPKRAPPTLDLEATEVIGKTDPEVSGDIDPEMSGETAPEMSDETAPDVSGETATEVSGETATEVSGETATEGTAETAARETADAGATSGDTPPAARPRAPWIALVVVSAITGAAAAGLVVAVVWLLGWPGDAASPAAVTPQVDTAAVDALATRVAKIESGTPTPQASASDPATATRIDALEQSMASLREELSAARSRSERLSAAVDELKTASRDASPPPDLTAINDRLAQIERATKAQIAETAQQSAKPADDTALRRIVAATLLDVAVRQGEPYAAALEAARALAPDPGVLAPLDPFAASGVPSPNALSRDLLALLPKPAPAETAAATGGIINRLQAGAARLVRIERTDAADGSDRTAVIVRAAGAAQRGDIAGARRELNALPPSDRAAVQSGIDRLDARDGALAASRQFAADATAALTKPAP